MSAYIQRDNHCFPSEFSKKIENWIPLNGHVIVEIFEEKERSGIIIPPDAQGSKFVGVVVSIADEPDPKKQIKIQAGQIVYFGWGGSKLEKVVNSDKFVLVPYDKILMVLNSN